MEATSSFLSPHAVLSQGLMALHSLNIHAGRPGDQALRSVSNFKVAYSSSVRTSYTGVCGKRRRVSSIKAAYTSRFKAAYTSSFKAAYTSSFKAAYTSSFKAAYTSSFRPHTLVA